MQKRIRNGHGTRSAHYLRRDMLRGVTSNMLKITQDVETPEIVRVSLCGSFTSEYVPEVETALVQNGNKSKKCTVDLMNVTFVDRHAMEFLRIAQARKIKLENLPSWVNRWIQQEAGNGANL